MSKWQPIETAPQDGTPILLTGDEGDMSVGSHDRFGWAIYPAMFDEFGALALMFEPTHWMSLPEPPK